jgi:hypothetical protein
MLWAYNRRRAGYFGIACKRHTEGERAPLTFMRYEEREDAENRKEIERRGGVEGHNVTSFGQAHEERADWELK